MGQCVYRVIVDLSKFNNKCIKFFFFENLNARELKKQESHDLYNMNAIILKFARKLFIYFYFFIFNIIILRESFFFIDVIIYES